MPQTPLNIPLGCHASAAITTSTGTQIKTGGGVLMGLNVLTAGAGWTATLYDGTSTAGVVLGTVSLAAVGPIVFPPLAFKTGLFVQTAAGTPGSAKVNYF